MADYSPEQKRLLLAAGCRFERSGKGDHEIWSSPITNVRFPGDSKNQVSPYRKRGLEAGWDAEKVLIAAKYARPPTDRDNGVLVDRSMARHHGAFVEVGRFRLGSAPPTSFHGRTPSHRHLPVAR